MNSKIIVFTIILCFLSCNQKKESHLPRWLLGTWNATMKEGKFTETWNVKENYFEGKSKLNQAGKIIFSEKIKLKYIKDTLNYIVIFNDNGIEKKVFFKAKTIKDSLLIFENSKNDFPKIIKYQFISNNRIKASIHGDNNNSEYFDFYKL